MVSIFKLFRTRCGYLVQGCPRLQQYRGTRKEPALVPIHRNNDCARVGMMIVTVKSENESTGTTKNRVSSRGAHRAETENELFFFRHVLLRHTRDILSTQTRKDF